MATIWESKLPFEFQGERVGRKLNAANAAMEVSCREGVQTSEGRVKTHPVSCLFRRFTVGLTNSHWTMFLEVEVEPMIRLGKSVSILPCIKGATGGWVSWISLS